MAIKSERELNAQQRDLWTRAKAAAGSQNFDYVISLLQTLLRAEPAFLEGRQLLRASEISKFKGQSSLSKGMVSVKATPLLMKLGGLAKKNPAEGMAVAEEVLALDPFNASANAGLAESAAALDLMEIAALAYETVREGKPNDKNNLHVLAKTYMKMGNADKAQTTYDAILKIDPRDGEAISGMKNASAAHASRSGGWETAKDYRDIIRDKEQATQLEQSSKVVKSESAIDEQIAELNQKHQAEPDSLVYPKKIAELLVQKEDFENAIVWYQYTFEKGGSTDGAIEKIVSDLGMKSLDRRIAAFPSEGLSEEDQATIAQLKLDRARIILENCKKRVERYPNDNQLRFELGEALVNAGQYKEAIPELQLGTKQPSVRLRALNLIGLAHLNRGMTDMAIKAFQNASSEILSMDPVKKDIVYNLAKALESVGRKDEAIEQYKQIYEVDMSYKDVSQKVEESYGSS